MMERTVAPSHPGGIIKRMYLAPLGMSNTALAEALGVSRKTVSKIVNERGGINTEMALRLSRAFNTTPDLWLNLQRNFDLWHATREPGDWQKIKPVKGVEQNAG
ncbi:MAG: HigA family addiction module antitoxin [Thermodesulfobacteriota bacterium]